MNESAPRPELAGTAYGRARARPNDLLTRVGPGTACGEYMRRFWQPVLTSAHVTNRPREVRILGEDLIVFRDKAGRPGLLYPRCMHRGTSLFWGRVEERGIRCCYHGWLFDVEGNCLEQPCEPNGGVNLANARQPWYPLEERYGVVWAYMGPPDKLPAFRRIDILEDLKPGEHIWADDNSLAATADYGTPVVPYSWLHMNDNIMDPFHVQQLHTTISVAQFADEFEVMPQVSFADAEDGCTYSAVRKLVDGREMDRVSAYILPNLMAVPTNKLDEGQDINIGITVPVDDTHCRIFTLYRAKSADHAFKPLSMRGKAWSQMTPEEHQATPGDYEAQAGQGPISLHSEEHLVTSDRGIAMQRRLLEREIAKVMAGEDPIGVTLGDGESAIVRVPSGNFYRRQVGSVEA